MDLSENKGANKKPLNGNGILYDAYNSTDHKIAGLNYFFS
jgi:hypothetical protein